MADPAKTVDQNILPVQALFNLDNSFNTFIGQGLPFFATVNPSQSGLAITNSTIDSTTIGALTPSTGVFTSISAVTGQISTSPSTNTDIANKLYVDTVAQGLGPKAACDVATTANITLSGLQTIDTYTTLVGDRVLVKNQTSSAQNGIYIAAANAWTRSTDMDVWSEVPSAYTVILNGSANIDTAWVCTASKTGTIGVTAMPWVLFSSTATYTAGTGLTLASNQFSIANTGVTAQTYGSASAVPVISVNAQGQITSATNTSIALAGSQITSGTISSSVISGSYTGITGVGTLTAGTWNATPIANSYLVNSSITVNGNSVSLGGSTTVTANTPNALTFNNGGSGGASGTTFNGSAAQTISYNSIGAPSTTGTNASGTWGINVTGNAATVTNGLYSTSSYSNPSWLTSILGSIVSGAVASATSATTATTSTNIAGGAAGSLPYQTGAGATSFLSIGTTNYVLTAGASTPQYVAQSTLSVGSAVTATTSTNLANGAASQIPYQTGAGATSFIANGTTGQVLTSNGASAPTWTNPSASITITDDTSTISTRYPLFASATSGTTSTEYTSSTKLQFVPSTGVLSATGFSGSGAALTSLTAANLSGTIPSAVLGNSTVYIGTTAVALNRASASISLTGTNIDGSAGSATTATTATNATNTAITDDTSSSATFYPTFVSNTSGNLPQLTSSTKLQYQPSTGTTISTIVQAGTQANYIQATGGTTGKAVQFQSLGSDAAVSLAIQSKGTGAIDLAAGSSGVNISNGGTVTAVTRTAAGSAYTSFPSLAISAPTTSGGVQATATPSVMIANAATIASGGTGYALSDVVTLSGGTPVVAATFTVTAVTGGVVTAVSSTNFGTYSVLPSNPVSTTGGTGTGLTLNVTWAVGTTFTITAAGSGYVEQPTVTFSGGGGSGAAAYATVGSNTTIKSIGNTIQFATPAGVQMQILDSVSSTPTSIVNINGSTFGIAYVSAAGSAGSSTLLLSSKGTSAVDVYTNSTGSRAASFSHTASAVNYVQVTGAATGGAPTISAQGSDGNPNLTINAKGTGAVNIGNNFVNYVRVLGGATGLASSVSAQGTDGNIDLALTPKGTGALVAQASDAGTTINARGANAVDWQTLRTLSTQVAAGLASVISGGSGGFVSNSYGAVLGGLANGVAGFGGGIVSGYNNRASANYSIEVGGYSNTASGEASFVGNGNANNAAGYFNFIGNGYSNSGTASAAVTTQSATMNGTTAVTLAATNANIKVGQLITGTSIATYPHTYVAAISGTSLTLSQAASGSSTSTLSFYTPHGVVVGGGNNQATGAYSFIGGGGDAGTAANRNTASGDWSFVGGGNKNIASGSGAIVVGGSNNQTSGNNYAFIGGGVNNLAGGYSSTILGGVQNTANNNFASCVGGQQNSATGSSSIVMGGERGTARLINGNTVFPASTQPIAASNGISQAALLVLGRQTTDATPTVLCSDASAASTTNQVILPNNSAYYFRGEIVAGVTGGGNTKGWTIEGVIKRGSGVGTAAIVGTPVLNVIAQDSGASTWTISITADTTNGGLSITVTGQASTTIRWVAKIQTTEMTY